MLVEHVETTRMKLARYFPSGQPHAVGVGIVSDETIVAIRLDDDLPSLSAILESMDPLSTVQDRQGESLPLSSIELLAPIDQQEVWAAGVTYKRSQTARMEESEAAASCYDRVYQSPRPELFLKATPNRVSGPGQPLRIRADSKWNVPEPELTLVVNSRKQLVGYTIGNDMSSRDIEGENLLYLPQAKVYHRSCAVGPWVRVGATEAEAREWEITIQIERGGETVFEGAVSVNQIKRTFGELSAAMFQSQVFPFGCALLTGTGIVPNDDFTLEEGDTVRIQISGIGCLNNPVVRV
ncbi:MAG: fumarylacetoacetate hydrolase family protein [Planctomycetaceae bacterium]